MRSLVFAAFLAAPAFADETCRSAATRACLLDHAEEMALASKEPVDLAAGLLSVAAGQEKAGLAESGETFRLLLDSLAAREASPGQAFIALDDAVIRVKDMLSDAPTTALALAQVFEGKGAVVLSPPTDKTRIVTSIVRAYALAGNEDEVEHWIYSSDYRYNGALPRLAVDMLMRSGDRIGARSLRAEPGDWTSDTQLDEIAITILLEDGDLDGAASVAARISDIHGWRDWQLLQVARAYAIEGSPKARVLVNAIELLPSELSDMDADLVFWFHLMLAEVYALIGDTEKANVLLAKAGKPSDGNPIFADYVRIILALKAHDIEGGLSILNASEQDFDAAVGAESLGAVLVSLAPADREAFLAGLGGRRGTVLRGMALVQIKRGEFDPAKATIQAVLASDVDDDGVAAQFARAWMKAGETAEAMEWAKVANEAPLFAELAALL